VGTIKGLGRIYQQTGIDAYANFGFAKVYTNKKADSAIGFVKTKVILVYGMFHIRLDRILTDNGKEYTTHWVNGNMIMKSSWPTVVLPIPGLNPGVPGVTV